MGGTKVASMNCDLHAVDIMRQVLNIMLNHVKQSSAAVVHTLSALVLPNAC